MSRNNDSVSGRDGRVGLIFDERMCKHYAPAEEDHPECPNRIRVIWNLLDSSGLAKRCIILKAKDAEDNHLALVHTKKHISLIKNISSRNTQSKRERIAAKFDSIYFNEGSTEAACLAAGSVIEAAEKVASGEIDSAFAIVRPPGHHAKEGEPMGFCLYNNVAIAASYLLNERQELGINKILIVDWDVHHGNGTQNMFYKDPRVLVFSVHRHDFGTFYPSGNGGSYIMTGEGEGAGYNINVPWEHGQCGDADYLAVWDHILIPVAKEFKPDIIIISAGFDAAKGDPLGGCCVSPNGYSVMLHKLMEFAGGKIVMALEGGYNLNSTASSALACVQALLLNEPPNVVSQARPFASTWRVIQQVCGVLRPYWPVLARIDNNHPTESDPVTSLHVPEKGLLHPCNMSSIKKSTGQSSGEADSLQTLAGDIGSGAGADKPANFPRPLRDLTGAECQAQIASSGLKEMDDMDPEKFADALCYAAKVERARKLAAAVRGIHSVAAALKAKAAELMTALEEELLAAQEAAAQLKAERDSLNTELERANAAKAEELEAAKQALTQAFSTRFQKAKTRWLAKAENAYILGMKECRTQFFLTARGHQFLRIMLNDTLEAFCRTPESLDVLGPGMGHLINDVCTLLMDQIGATPEQRALYDFDQIVDSVDAEGLDRVLGIDSQAPRTPAWWAPVVDKALKQFVEGTCADPLPTSPLLRTPYLDRLQAAAATRLNAEAAAGEPLFYPRPPAAAMTGAAAMELQASATHDHDQLRDAMLC